MFARLRMGLALPAAVAALMLTASSAGVFAARPPGAPGFVGAASAQSAMQASILAKVNAARATLGLTAFRSDSQLARVAVLRARFMAESGVLGHDTYHGSVDAALNAIPVTWFAVGEAVAQSLDSLGEAAASAMFTLWLDDPPHWELLSSRSFNYVGVGVAQAANGDTYGSVVLAELSDRTAPTTAITSATVTGTTLRFAWKGTDPLLQARTAGLRGFNVQYRVDQGTWSTIRTLTTATSLTLTARKPGHVYSVRVQAVDRQANTSAYTVPRSLRVR